MYDYLRCECCDYIPDEFDLSQNDYYFLTVCHHCGRKVCPYYLVMTTSTAEELFQQFEDKDEDNRRWRVRCRICRGEHKGDIRGFHDAFLIWRALKGEHERKNRVDDKAKRDVMWLVDVLIKECIEAGEKIEAYKNKLADKGIHEDSRREFRSTLAYLFRQRRFIEKALAENGYDIEKLLLRRAAEEAIAEAHRAGIATVHGDDGGIYHMRPNGKKEYIIKKK